MYLDDGEIILVVYDFDLVSIDIKKNFRWNREFGLLNIILLIRVLWVKKRFKIWTIVWIFLFRKWMVDWFGRGDFVYNCW